MLDHIILYTLKSVSENVNLIIFFDIKIKNKIIRLTFSDTLLNVYKIMWSNIIFRPEEAMLETGKSLSTELKLVLFWRQ